MPSDLPSSSQRRTQPKQKLVQVGNYRLLSLRLGEGASSKVELACHRILHTKVAIKVISLKDINDAYILRNLERESRIMARLNHPNVARLFEVQSHSDYHFLMMELYPGGDLLDHLSVNVRLEEDVARKFFVQIIKGLEYIHSQGIIHRDLKLENLMMDRTKTKLVISDFGLSNWMSKGKALVTRCGTEEYAAPELLDKHCQYDKEVDVWSSGIVLYTLLVGERPFYNSGSNRKFLQEISQGLQEHHQVALMAASCSEEVRELLSKVLTSVQDRLRAEDILSHAWLSGLGSVSQRKRLELEQELEVAKSVQTRLGLNCWAPNQILSYVKSSKGRLGKTAGVYNILAKQMEESIQASDPDLTMAVVKEGSTRKVLGDLDKVVVEKPRDAEGKSKENDLVNVKVAQVKTKDWKRTAKRLERI